ncbi:MAG: glutamine synthetase III [Eubacteriales bacterium]|nr:glutamine synthetase III [bacterium]MDY2792197.1 glutamine synthetase III [Eubacteriales bacterium]
METFNPSDVFGSMVFNDHVMRERLPHATYKEFKKTLAENRPLSREIANIMANAMKDWAIEKGATHYTHWFQPMTGITAEKHESFITPDGDQVIMEFSGKELVKGEPDASSFPSGGLRATFEARGYTAWDPTSYAFIKDNTLCIPTAFCSYTGEALDKKTPLLRSMRLINDQALRILRLFGKTDVNSVTTTVGAEQEYFLVDKADFDKRPDLIFTGRTLFGARPPKGQELEDHYFGTLKPRVAEFMHDLDKELWKLGILAKTEHNEVAPAQHELAPIFASTNVATDHNQLTMEFMRKVAARHGLVCLLHEKPFAGVNGSGKHNNWSMSTDTGVNLLEPGDNPSDNAQFLLFLCAVIKAVDENQDLLRITVASAGNDHRLGASEAPPAIISMFLGDDLTEMLTAIEGRQAVSAHEKTRLDIGVNVTPRFSRDTTDRNRTSPFAFTGNKFEFRSLGSSFSIAGPNIILNTIVGDALRQFADRLEAAEDFNVELNRIVRHTMRDHKRIIFNGNNYSDEWRAEAARRGLLNYPSAVDALPHFTDEKNVALFTRYGIFSETEIRSRRDILLENYIKVIHIEALTMQDMVNRDLLPAILRYTGFLTDNALKKAQLGLTAVPEKAMAEKLSALSASIVERSALLSDRLLGAADAGALIDEAKYYKDSVFSVMNELRAVVDETELLMPTDVWPYPTYGKLLFDVR